MNWNLFVTELVAGITHGSVYALIALGYSMVYGILKLLNFAHGDVYMIGAFLGFFALQGLGGPGKADVTAWLAVSLMFIAAMLGCGILGVVIERFAYRPLRNAPRIAPLISALGVSFFLQNSALLLFGSQIRNYDSGDLTGIDVGGVHIWAARILIVAMAVVMMIGLTLFVGHTKLGRAIRSVSFDREA